jgi:putative transposase
MSDYGSLADSKWDSKYNLVLVPRYRKKKLFFQVGQYLGPVLHELARQKNIKVIEGHMMPGRT